MRGGTPGQNLILLDDVVVYNPNHLFGFFSTFNPDALKNVTLIKGTFPARYGDRLSSVLDITNLDGNRKAARCPRIHGSDQRGIDDRRTGRRSRIVDAFRAADL